VGAPVTIGNIRAALNGFSPELGLYQLHIAPDNKQTAAELGEIHIGIDLFALFSKSWIESLKVSLVRAKLSITRLKSGQIEIAGLPSNPDDEEPRWLMQGRQYKLINSEIEWQDKKHNTDKIQFKHVNIILNNQHSRHKVLIQAMLPKNLGTTLDIKMDFTGDVFTFKNMSGKLFVQGVNINFSQLPTEGLPFDVAVVRGRGDFSLWSTWQETKMVSLSGSMQIKDTLLQDTKEQQKKLQLESVNLNFKLQKKNGWQLAIENSELNSHDIAVSVPALAVSWQKNDQGEWVKLAVSVPYLDLGNISKIIDQNSLLPEAIRSPAEALALDGVLSQLQIYTDIEAKKFSVEAELNKLSFKPYKGVPGVQNLALSLQGTEAIGKISLKSEELEVNFHELFREPLSFKQVKGDVFWQQQINWWQLSSSAVQLNTEDIKTKSRLNLLLPKNENPVKINLQSFFYEGRNTKIVSKYLPVGIMDKPLVTWLDNAFLAGEVDQGSVILRGELKDFPYAEHQGIFEVLFGAKNVALHYADGWNNIDNLDADIRFFSDSLTVDINKGSVNKAEIKTARVAIDSFLKSDYLTIQGDVNAEIPQAINFLKFSPFKKAAKQLDKHFVMQGNIGLKLNLEIPLADVPIKVSIDAKINNAEAEIIPSHIKVKKINASLHITENAVFSDDLSAQVFSFPMTGSIKSNSKMTDVKLASVINIEQLKNYQPSALWQHAQGRSEYQINLRIPKKSRESSQLKISSNLKGIAINLAPFSKTSKQKHPFSAEIYLNEVGLKGAHFSYDNKTSKENALDINFKRIKSSWQGLFYSPFAAGSFFMPLELDKQSVISFNLKSLNLSALKSLELKSDKSNDTPFLVKTLPRITLGSEKVYYQGKNYGTLKVETSPMKDGLLIKQVSLSHKNSQLDLSGRWFQKKQNKTQIKGTIKDKNFGKLLRTLKISENLYHGDANFGFDLNWKDAPYKISKKNISGTLKVNLEQGRLLGVEPGLGRILGGLDIWKLMDRLSLDFSDVVLEGLSFTKIEGDITLNKGKVEIPKLYIDAMPAEIYLSGHTNLVTQALDLHATVLPKYPVAGAMIGNIANTVTKVFVGDELAGGLLLSLRYDMTGNWKDVKVNRRFMPFLQNKISP
jgi:uncharacterized protein YhdP